MFLFVFIGSTRLTTGHKLGFFIIKMISEHISVEVEEIFIRWIFTKLLQRLKQNLVFIIQSDILEYNILCRYFC